MLLIRSALPEISFTTDPPCVGIRDAPREDRPDIVHRIRISLLDARKTTMSGWVEVEAFDDCKIPGSFVLMQRDKVRALYYISLNSYNANANV